MDINSKTNQIYLTGRSDGLIRVIDGNTNEFVEFKNTNEFLEFNYTGKITQSSENITPETTIVFQITKLTYPELVEFHVSGKITNYNFPELTYIDMYNVDTGEKVRLHDYIDNTDDKIIDYGSYLIRSNFDVLYKVVVSHNDVSASKTFTVKGVEESIVHSNSTELETPPIP